MKSKPLIACSLVGKHRLKRIAIALSVLVSIVAGGCANQPVDGAPQQVLIPLVYVTDRSLNDGARPGRYYGGGRGAPQAGIATVAVSTHGAEPNPFADWRRWEPRLDGSRRRNEFVSVSASGTPPIQTVTDFAVTVGTGTAIVYVHGFRRRFDTASVNFAELLYQVSPDAVPILYSWPSTGGLLNYRDDVENLQWSNGTLQSLLVQLLADPKIETIHVVAHSLGAFALLEAVAAVADNSTEELSPGLGQIILVSPDVARERFESKYLPIIRENDLQVTIYAAENDVPLRTSRRVNKGERVGDAKKQVPVFAGIETVLVSDVVSIMNSHDSHLEVAQVQIDIAYLLNDGLPADSRPTLQRTDSDYWRIKPDLP